MAQRHSGYARRPDENYETPLWVAGVIATWLREEGVRRIWEPAPGSGAFARHLENQGFEVTSTHNDFFSEEKKVEDALVTNPPYGASRRNELAAGFARKALVLEIPIVALLLPVDFDSAVSRRDLFAGCSAFAGKIVLLDRIVFFEHPRAAPSTNHAWFCWSRSHRGRPWIAYGVHHERERNRIDPR